MLINKFRSHKTFKIFVDLLSHILFDCCSRLDFSFASGSQNLYVIQCRYVLGSRDIRGRPVALVYPVTVSFSFLD